MKELAIKHRDYILQCHANNTASKGNINQELRKAYVRETGEHVGGCGSCLLNTVIPKYVRLIRDLDNGK